jgi:hypothetical protein
MVLLDIGTRESQCQKALEVTHTTNIIGLRALNTTKATA